MDERLTPAALPARVRCACRIRRLTLSALLPLTLIAVAARPARAQSAAVRADLEAAGISAEDARRLLESRGLTSADLERMLRDRAPGLPADSAAAQAAPAPAGAPVQPWTPDPNRADSAGTRPVEPAGAHGLEPFGYEIFGYSPTTFEPLDYGPVDPDYVVGPGDELLLTLWGDDQLTASLPVSRDGAVTLPVGGQVTVAGLTLGGAKARLQATLARHYSGLAAAGARGSTRLDLTLGRLRSIQVFLLGDVVKPGGYTISSVSRVLNALYAAGGPRRSGSMRDVRVLRGGRVVAHVDLYDVVLGGDTSKEVRLESGDVIFVPPAGPRVALDGAVRRPAVYELAPGEPLTTLLRLAGGVLTTADLSRAQIQRVVPFEQRAAMPGRDRVALDVPLGEILAGRAADVALQDLDAVAVFSIGARSASTVRIASAAVVRPGVYAWRPGLTVRGLVEAAGGLLPEAYLARAQIVRTLDDSTRTMLRFDLGRALAGDPEHDLALLPLDSLGIASKWEMRQRYTVTVDGAVRRPGAYEFLEGMTLGDLLFLAGGLTDAAYPLRAEIARVDSVSLAPGRLADTLIVPLDSAAVTVPEPRRFALRERDVVFIRRDPAWLEPQYVTLAGEVRFPGRYALGGRDERLADVVRRAGGLTPQAYAAGAVFTRGQGAGRLSVRLDDALRDRRSRHNLVLQDGDALEVPTFRPEVRVEGAVRHPVSVLWTPGRTADWYVVQASGYAPDADRGGAVVISPSGDVARARRLLGDPHPQPGSRIVVPAAPPRERGDTLKDVASIMTVITGALTTAYLIREVSR